MLERIRAMLAGTTPEATADTVATPFARRVVAVAVLLLEVAQSDRGIGEREMAAIENVLRERFRLGAEATKALVEAGRMEFDIALEDWIFARQVRDGFDLSERIDIVRTMWELVYADGRLARLEESRMRRLGEALRIQPAEFEALRTRAAADSAPEGDEVNRA
jgi:uncharacterized tellurite resistance protein B-like protein